MAKDITKPMIRIHNTETDEIIDREMTDDEFAAYQAYQANVAEYDARKKQQENGKAALLARLGLTEDELKTILG